MLEPKTGKTEELEKLSELESKRANLLRTARFSLGGLLILLCSLVIVTLTFRMIDPLAIVTFQGFLISIGILVVGWILLALAVKRKLGALKLEVSLLRTIAMIFGPRRKMSK